jgi:hypothetical protein
VLKARKGVDSYEKAILDRRNQKEFGDVAQLGERLPCTQDVAGSTPVISTKLRAGSSNQLQLVRTLVAARDI